MGRNILGRHELQVVPLRHKSAGEEMSARARFDPDQTCRRVHHVREQLLAAEALLLNNVAFLAQANQMKYGLTNVDAANVYCHGEILLCSPSSCHRQIWKTTDHPITPYSRPHR